MGLATVAVLGDLVDPFGAIALGRSVGEPADVVGAVLVRRVESRQPPLDRRQLGARDLLAQYVWPAITTSKARGALWDDPPLFSPRVKTTSGG